jgi:hypothetical protein
LACVAWGRLFSRLWCRELTLLLLPLLLLLLLLLQQWARDGRFTVVVLITKPVRAEIRRTLQVV